jgi:hypothetical protein
MAGIRLDFSAKGQIMWVLRCSVYQIEAVESNLLTISHLTIFLANIGASLVCRFEAH